MSDPVRFASPLARWTGNNGGSWYLVSITGDPAQDIATHALMRRLEEGRARGFGSVKVRASLGDTRWDTSLFPQGKQGWVMLVKKDVRKAEGLSEGDEVEIEIDLL